MKVIMPIHSRLKMQLVISIQLKKKFKKYLLLGDMLELGKNLIVFTKIYQKLLTIPI